MVEVGESIRIKKNFFVEVCKPTDACMEQMRRAGCRTNMSARFHGDVRKCVSIPRIICPDILLETIHRSKLPITNDNIAKQLVRMY